MEPYVITISRQFASLGRTIAQELSKRLGIEFYDRDIVEAAAKRMELPVSIISDEEEQANNAFLKRKHLLGLGVVPLDDEIFQVEANIIQDLTARESCIIVGRCSHYLLKDHPKSLHIYVYAPYEARLHNCMNVLQMDEKTAHSMIREVDKDREVYRKRYAKGMDNIYDAFDLMIDSSRFGVEGTVSVLTDIVKQGLKLDEPS
ncbi:cytidylate kinase-like family protein [Petrocella sp. FN5]|uniref:cytidylate kinase-like family protein n=1 Tax=Petrocella sp. FN5 TaxID=3032002 RepID=UPI0023DC782C|nr:cytidylate kinase-like family protein [Petrocella sp. FN5]MDF1618106.1 cytidylate kinase-like family protein [Petrocella sp. FN5]